MAERALITRPTLAKVERGDPAVSLGIYAAVLFVLGLADRLGELADARADTVGLALEEERLPQRVYRSRRTGRTRAPNALTPDASPGDPPHPNGGESAGAPPRRT